MMEGKKKKQSKVRALLVFGAPGSGKTTFAEKFAEKFGLAYYDLEQIMEEYSFSRDQIFNILTLIMKTKQNIILEGGLDTEKDRIELRNHLRSNGYEPSLFWLQTDVATIRMRLKNRYRSVAKAMETYDRAVATMEAPAETERPIILSGKHTFDTQARHALTGLADLVEAK